MMMETVLVWSERFLAFAIFFQTLELLKLRPIWADTGIWRWHQVRMDYRNAPVPILKCLDFILEESHFHRVLQLRLVLSVLVWIFHPAIFIFILFFSTWLISIRWRGIFNGGNDSMTALIAVALFIAQAMHDHPLAVKACLAYIAVQVTASYFIAGWVKLKNYQWREASALSLFFETPRYDSPPPWLKEAMKNKVFARVVSWSVIGFELSFPLAWAFPSAAVLYLSLGFFFHLCNFYVFGLNRFVFAWLAGYPAVYFWSHR